MIYVFFENHTLRNLESLLLKWGGQAPYAAICKQIRGYPRCGDGAPQRPARVLFRYTLKKILGDKGLLFNTSPKTKNTEIVPLPLCYLKISPATSQSHETICLTQRVHKYQVCSLEWMVFQGNNLKISFSSMSAANQVSRGRVEKCLNFAASIRECLRPCWDLLGLVSWYPSSAIVKLL